MNRIGYHYVLAGFVSTVFISYCTCFVHINKRLFYVIIIDIITFISGNVGMCIMYVYITLS